MGLTVNVYTNIKLTTEDDYDFKAYVIDDEWLFKIKNLEVNQFYRGDKLPITFNYAYSNHNRFREWLVKLIDRSDLLLPNDEINWDILPKDIPFYDFINFADNVGCLDWEISEKIFNDFEKYMPIVATQEKSRWVNYYESWYDAFNEAKNNKGVVVFN